MNFGYLFAAKALAYPMVPAMAWWGWLLVILGIILTILIILGFIGSANTGLMRGYSSNR